MPNFNVHSLLVHCNDCLAMLPSMNDPSVDHCENVPELIDSTTKSSSIVHHQVNGNGKTEDTSNNMVALVAQPPCLVDSAIATTSTTSGSTLLSPTNPEGVHHHQLTGYSSDGMDICELPIEGLFRPQLHYFVPPVQEYAESPTIDEVLEQDEPTPIPIDIDESVSSPLSLDDGQLPALNSPQPSGLVEPTGAASSHTALRPDPSTSTAADDDVGDDSQQQVNADDDNNTTSHLVQEQFSPDLNIPSLESTSNFDDEEQAPTTTSSAAVVVATTTIPDYAIIDDLHRQRSDNSASVESLQGRLTRLQTWQSISHVKQNVAGFVAKHSAAVENVQDLQRDPVLRKRLELLLNHCPMDGFFVTSDELNSVEKLLRLIRRFDVRKFSDLIPTVRLRSFDQVKYLRTPNSLRDLDQKKRDRINKFAIHKRSKLRVTQKECDDDVTDSSSANESVDDLELNGFESEETESEDEKERPSKPISTRCSYQFWRRRARLAHRWSWLQSQVAELETKIKRYESLEDQMKTQQLGRRIQLENTDNDVETDPITETCARVRPLLQQTTPRPHRLTRVAGMYSWNRKTLQQASVFCTCLPPLEPCVLCAGRMDPVDQDPDPCSQTFHHRESIVNHALHVVLGDGDVDSAGSMTGPLQSSIVELGSHQQIVKLRRKRTSDHREMTADLIPLKSALLDAMTSELEATASQSRHKRSASDSISELKDQLNHILPNPLRGFGLHREDGSKASSGSMTPVTPAFGTSVDFNAPFVQSGLLSPRLGSGVAMRRTMPCSSTTGYDIDSIVIDSSVASVMKVVRLSYKEILTPGWIVSEKDGPSNEPKTERIDSPLRRMSAGRDQLPIADATAPSAEHTDDANMSISVDRTSDDELDDVDVGETKSTTPLPPAPEIMSDDAFLARHRPTELEEMDRFDAYKQWVHETFLKKNGTRVSTDGSIGSPSPAPNCHTFELRSRRQSAVPPPDENPAAFRERTFPISEPEFEQMEEESRHWEQMTLLHYASLRGPVVVGDEDMMDPLTPKSEELVSVGSPAMSQNEVVDEKVED